MTSSIKSTTTPVASLNLTHSISLVVGVVIGTGVFLKTGLMTALLGDSRAVAAAWIVAGLLSLAGTFIYAELSARMPAAGGEYVFLRQQYGNNSAFLYGWSRFWIASPGSIAAYAVGASTFFLSLYPSFSSPKLLSCVFIVFFTGLNLFRVSFGGGVQTLLTFLKLFLLVGLIMGATFLAAPHEFTPGAVAPGVPVTFTFSSFGMAVLAALWAFDGWNNIAMVGGEIKHPKRNIPLALIIGLSVVTAAYLLTNAAYFKTLSVETIANSYSRLHPEGISVATLCAQTFLGVHATKALAVALIISALGAMNGSILTAARVPFAMAQDGLFFPALAHCHPQTQVPYNALLTQALLSCVLALSGTFDELTDAVVFSSWIFYGLCSLSLVKLRAAEKGQTNIIYDGFRCPLFPWIPWLFCFSSAVLLVNTVLEQPRQCALGLGVFVIGAIFRKITK